MSAELLESWERKHDGTVLSPDGALLLDASEATDENARLIRLAHEMASWIARALTTGRLDPPDDDPDSDPEGSYYAASGRALVARARGDEPAPVSPDEEPS